MVWWLLIISVHCIYSCMFAILTKVKNKVSCGDYGLCFHKAVVDKSMQIGCSN